MRGMFVAFSVGFCFNQLYKNINVSYKLLRQFQMRFIPLYNTVIILRCFWEYQYYTIGNCMY